MPVSVGKERLPKHVMEEHQRDRVIAAAIGVFAKRGYPATTVDHIVAAAKVGVGGFYTLFKGKEDCFLRAYESILASWREQISSELPAEGSWPEQVDAALRTVLEMIAADPSSARVAIVEAQAAGPAAIHRYEETIDVLVPYLRRGRELSPIADELPPALEVAVLGGALWLLQQRIVAGETKEIEDVLPDLTRIVTEPYLGEEGVAALLAAG